MLTFNDVMGYIRRTKETKDNNSEDYIFSHKLLNNVRCEVDSVLGKMTRIGMIPGSGSDLFKSKNKNISLMSSIMFSLYKSFRKSDDNEKLIQSYDLHEQLYRKITTNKKKYSTYGWKVTSMLNNYSNYEYTHPDIQFIADVLGVNIIIIDVISGKLFGFHTLVALDTEESKNTFNCFKNTIIFAFVEDSYEPVSTAGIDCDNLFEVTYPHSVVLKIMEHLNTIIWFRPLKLNKKGRRKAVSKDLYIPLVAHYDLLVVYGRMYEDYCNLYNNVYIRNHLLSSS